MVFFLKRMLSSQRVYLIFCQRAPDSINMLSFFLSTPLTFVSSMKRPKSCLFKSWIAKRHNTLCMGYKRVSPTYFCLSK